MTEIIIVVNEVEYLFDRSKVVQSLPYVVEFDRMYLLCRGDFCCILKGYAVKT